MRALVWLIAVFAAAAAIAVFGRLNGGYALFVVPPWRVELSLLSFGVAAAVVFAAAYAFARVIGRTIALPAQVRAYRERRRRERAHGALAAALQAHLEGRFARAEREARLAWEAGAAPGLAALLAARAAQGQLPIGPNVAALVVFSVLALRALPDLLGARPEAFTHWKMMAASDELAREAGGLAICALWSALQTAFALRARRG